MWFTGHHQDEDSGIIYAGARHYDPVIGRFMSVDPVGVDPGNGFSFNRYVYGNDNPYRYKDPDGQVPVETFWDIGNVIYDVGKISVGWTIGNQALVVEGTGDLIVDGVSVLVPYVPAGSTKVARLGVKATEVAAKRKAIDPNRLQPIFGKSEHLLDDFVRESGGAEQAYRRIEDAANAALRDGKLVPGPKGILPSGNGGPLIDVDGTQIRLIGGRVKDGVVELSSASRKGVP
jgi:RHS repeat-associated protein